MQLHTTCVTQWKRQLPSYAYWVVKEDKNGNYFFAVNTTGHPPQHIIVGVKFLMPPLHPGDSSYSCFDRCYMEYRQELLTRDLSEWMFSAPALRRQLNISIIQG